MLEHAKEALKIEADSIMALIPRLDDNVTAALNMILACHGRVVLTGMGADGREGARMLKQSGSQVWAQDEASCVIYGMPMAVVKAGLADAIYSLDDMAGYLVEACS